MLGPLPVHDPVGESDAVFTVAGGVHELCRCLEILAVHGVDEPLVDIGGADAWAPAGCAHADPSLTQVTRRCLSRPGPAVTKRGGGFRERVDVPAPVTESSRWLAAEHYQFADYPSTDDKVGPGAITGVRVPTTPGETGWPGLLTVAAAAQPPRDRRCCRRRCATGSRSCCTGRRRNRTPWRTRCSPTWRSAPARPGS